MPSHRILPKSAIEDVRSLLGLQPEPLARLVDLFAKPESVDALDPEFISTVEEQLQLNQSTAESVVLLCEYLLTLVQQGQSVEGVIGYLREFVAKNCVDDDRVLAAFDEKQAAIRSLLTPKPDRLRAQKVQYLARGPNVTADSFRTICELRPVFETSAVGVESIAGFVATTLMEMKVSDTDGEQHSVLFHLTPESLGQLAETIQRTQLKLDAIRAQFGDQLLG